MDPKCLKKGAVLGLKMDPQIMLDSGAEKVVNLDAPRLANGTLGTSKIIEINWRGCEFQLFKLFSWKTLLMDFGAPRGSF